jgi:hypothetical protein
MAGEIQLNSTTLATESSGSITAELDTIRPNTTNGSLTLQGDSSNAGVTGLTIDSSGNATFAQTITGGTIGSGVVFPAGKIINVGYGTVADLADQAQHFSSNSITFGTTSGIPALSSSSNKVFMIWTGQWEKRAGGTGAYFIIYATGGGLGSTTSGQKLTDNIFYIDPNNHRKIFTMPIYDVSPGSTTPTYSLYHNSNPNSTETWSNSTNRIMTFEIQG